MRSFHVHIFCHSYTSPDLAAVCLFAAPFNQRIQPSPAAIVYPTSPEQVAAAVQCAASNSATVSARSGGHSYAAYGLAGQLVIDLSHFQDVTVQDDIALIGGGARLGDIALALNNVGRALPHGVWFVPSFSSSFARFLTTVL